MVTIERFIKAQDQRYEGYRQALEEITNGNKESHWIWYVFPQLRGLGHSSNATFYGIFDREEAIEYLAHPILGARLREISSALLSHRGKPAEDILGSIDAMKVRSCMTLFDSVSPDDIFAEVLDAFYDGERDPKSLV